MKQLGRYEILRELGHGAMGVVYAAMDPLIGRQVAIKAIRLGALDVEANHAELTQRLHREARAAGVLTHPGIITIYDVGEQGEDAYIVMEFIDGKTVEEMLASEAPQRSATLLSILRKTADTLDYAHSKGIIHRDIKPSNIMICPDGMVKVADFGVAKLTASASLTQSGFVLGTPSYMSPEQAQGRTIDGRSDQFSLAVVAYRLLTGKLPFEGATLTALLTKILWEEPEYDSAGLTLPIRPIFEKALSKNPQLRYPNCSEFVRDLEDSYARKKAAAPGDFTLMTARSATPADSKAATPVLDREVATTLALEATESDRMRAAQAASVAPTLDMPETKKEKTISRPPASVTAGLPAQAPKSKYWVIAVAAVLVVAALAVTVFLVLRSRQAQAPPVQTVSTETAKAVKSEPAVIVQPPSDAAKPVPPPEPLKQPEKQEKAAPSPASTAPPVSDKTAAKEISVPKPKQPVTPVAQPASSTGTISWSGSLEKNSVLVIEEGANIGTVTGQLPRKPVTIEIEPKNIIIRQRPGENNHWDRIILYSGNQRYTSITIRWKLIQ